MGSVPQTFAKSELGPFPDVLCGSFSRFQFWAYPLRELGLEHEFRDCSPPHSVCYRYSMTAIRSQGSNRDGSSFLSQSMQPNLNKLQQFRWGDLSGGNQDFILIGTLMFPEDNIVFINYIIVLSIVWVGGSKSTMWNRVEDYIDFSKFWHNYHNITMIFLVIPCTTTLYMSTFSFAFIACET